MSRSVACVSGDHGAHRQAVLRTPRELRHPRAGLRQRPDRRAPCQGARSPAAHALRIRIRSAAALRRPDRRIAAPRRPPAPRASRTFGASLAKSLVTRVIASIVATSGRACSLCDVSRASAISCSNLEVSGAPATIWPQSCFACTSASFNARSASASSAVKTRALEVRRDQRVEPIQAA